MIIDRASTWPFTNAQWYALPMVLRHKWWRVTDYSTKPPPADLRYEVQGVLDILESEASHAEAHSSEP